MNARATTRVKNGTDSRRIMQGGIDLLASLVAHSIGPVGRSVLSSRSHARPQLVRSGYMIARELDGVADDLRAGIILMREMAWKIQDQVGDGTSTGILLAHQFAHEFDRLRSSGAADSAFFDQANAHGTEIIRALRSNADRKPDHGLLRDIATRAAGGDAAIGHLIADAANQAGDNGLVLIENSKASEDRTDIASGLHFDSSLLSPHFLDDWQSQTVELTRPLILFHHGGIGSLSAIAPVLEMISKAQRSLLVVADEILDEALSTLIINKRRGGLRVAAVKSPGAGLWRLPMMEDIAIATGGDVLSPLLGTGLSNLSPAIMGQADTVRVTRNRTMITGGYGDPDQLALRCASIRHQIEAERNLSWDREQHQIRLARLTGAVARIQVGGRTETEQEWRENAARRAAAAIHSARTDGLAPGGASALIAAARQAEAALTPDPTGRAIARLFYRCLAAPTVAICANAGLDGKGIARQLQQSEGAAYDVMQRQFVSDFALAEPVSVLTTALAAAMSTATQIAGVETYVGTRKTA